jgi:hypothetical protein
MNRRFLLLALAAPLTAAGPKASPLAAVQELYTGLPRPTPLGLLSPRLRALFQRDEARRERNLDFEWRSGGQENPVITGYHARLIRMKGDAAVVEVSFYNRGERRFRRFFLIRDAGRWLVDDALLVPENGKLADFLRGKG